MFVQKTALKVSLFLSFLAPASVFATDPARSYADLSQANKTRYDYQFMRFPNLNEFYRVLLDNLHDQIALQNAAIERFGNERALAVHASALCPLPSQTRKSGVSDKDRYVELVNELKGMRTLQGRHNLINSIVTDNKTRRNEGLTVELWQMRTLEDQNRQLDIFDAEIARQNRDLPGLQDSTAAMIRAEGDKLNRIVGELNSLFVPDLDQTEQCMENTDVSMDLFTVIAAPEMDAGVTSIMTGMMELMTAE